MLSSYRATRREAIDWLGGAAAAACVVGRPGWGNAAWQSDGLKISCQQVPWVLYLRRDAQPFSIDAALAGAAAAGLKAFEPVINSAEQLAAVAAKMRMHGLTLRSLYVEGTLHEPGPAEECHGKVAAIADAAREAGTEIILVRPRPLPNGRELSKSDEQLTVQAEQLERIGAMLNQRGIRLAWPNHDIELLHSAREFHHMLAGTKPENLGLCLDIQWVHRGAGNSQVALFDIVALHGRRIVELHLRQTQNGVFSEALGDGDIDLRRLHKQLRSLEVPMPHLVLDQAPENGTPQTISAVEAHRQGMQYIQEVFTA